MWLRLQIGLPGFAAWFKNESDEERSHAQLLVDFQVGPDSPCRPFHARSFLAGRPSKPVIPARDSLLPTFSFTSYRGPGWWLQNKRGGRVKLHTLVSPETECASISSCPLCPRSGDPAASQ